MFSVQDLCHGPMIRFGIVVRTLELALLLPWLGTCSELRFLRNQINGLGLGEVCFMWPSFCEQCHGRFFAWSVEILVIPISTGYMLPSFGFLYYIKEYSTYSSKLISNFPEILNLNRLYLQLNWKYCANRCYTELTFTKTMHPNVMEHQVQWQK